MRATQEGSSPDGSGLHFKSRFVCYQSYRSARIPTLSGNHNRFVHKLRIELDTESRPRRNLHHAVLALERRRVTLDRRRVAVAFVLLMQTAVRHARGEMGYVEIAEPSARHMRRAIQSGRGRHSR